MVIRLGQNMGRHVLKQLSQKAKSIKVFDWVLIAFGLTAIIVFLIIFFRKSTYITVTVDVGQNDIAYDVYTPQWTGNSGIADWYSSAFYKGEAEVDGLGREQAVVLNVFRYDKGPDRSSVYLTLKLNAVYNKASNSYTYKGVPVLVGSNIKLNLGRVYADGYITNVDGFPNNENKKTLILETQIREENSTYTESSGTKAYIADAINIGDVVKDNSGQAVITVIGKNVRPSLTTVSTANGQIVEAFNPDRKDVFLTLQVDAQKINNRYYLMNDIPILIDQPIPINTQTVSVFPVVTKFISEY